MNYLAHAFLSFNNADLLIGNMISDHVKGKKQFDYSAGVQAGIQLHRAIDEFTDFHPATAEIKKLFKPAYRLYAGAFTDVVYDYFLANDAQQFLPSTLAEFCVDTYATLSKHSDVFPEKFAGMFPYMKTQNWLYNYRLDDGMQKAFNGLARRSMYIEDSSEAFQIFISNKPFVKAHYDVFFADVKSFAAKKSEQLLNR